MAVLHPDKYNISYFDMEKVLEIDCAKGYIVSGLRDFGVGAHEWKKGTIFVKNDRGKQIITK